jgi:arabinan endo-1,5-alpha-L-arabinosidase
MKKNLILLLLALLPISVAAYTLKRVSVHDPSIVWEPNTQTYYIFGSHRAAAKTKDLMNWTEFKAPWKAGSNNDAADNVSFTTPAVTKVKKGGQEYDFNFDAQAWSKRGNSGYNIGGNLWAPDVVYNKAMQKWCMYMSVNGDAWFSSIVLLTADNIEGPYTYQAPVVISGFKNGTSYKDTDLEIVIGEQASLPERYNVGNKWGERYPNNIDPCVFYDEEGKLWMSYGSWSGGIWMLELDENTGLRDYDVDYELVGEGNGITVDPYFGKKIAGGYYASGEASYIEYIGGYYFLFVTNGGLAAGGVANDYNNGGYQMRVFRSEKPDGPYVDANGNEAILPRYLLNFGASENDGNRGVNIFGAYGEWGNQTRKNYSERSQGHNSIIAAEDGRTYLVYHTRFQNRGEGHEVRVHQVFQNEEGWLVAAPFEYTGEEVKSADIANSQQIATDQIAGGYKLLVHNYKLDHTKKALSKPVEISLNADGTITGDNNGQWTIQEGKSYINITLGNTLFQGVMVEQTMEPSDDKVPAFTAMAKNGVSIWGYKYTDVTTPEEPETPVEATWTYKQDFSTTDGLTIVGGGSFVEDATFGHAYQNGGGAIRSHYLLLPEDVLSHAQETQQMTIAFWVNAANAGALNDYTYAPFFTAYANAPGASNTTPMLALQSRGPVQINNSGWCDFTGANHAGGKVNIYHQNAWEAGDASYNFVRNWLDDGKWHYYAITFKAKEVIQYMDGEMTNQWTLYPTVDGQNVTGLFDHGGDLKYICLGGNQAWDWGDKDAKFMFARLLIQNNAMTADDIKAQMAEDTTTGIQSVVTGKSSDGQYYDLRGQQIASPQKKGIYIKDGKKIVIK